MRTATEGFDEPPHPREMLVPLNQLLYDEQVALIRAAEANAGKAGSFPMPFKPTRSNIRPAIAAIPAARPSDSLGATYLTRSPVELTRAQIAAVDRWAGEWDVTRREAIDRLIEQGGGSSHLMRSS